MIKITSFYPFQNFMRITQDFYEDKAVVKIKSLMLEHEYEFEYKDVGEISDTLHTDDYQRNFSYTLLLFTSFTLMIFRIYIYPNPIFLWIEQILYSSGIFLFAISFIKNRRINIIDKKNNYLAYIKQTRKNRALIPQVLEMVKNKANNIQEVTTANPFPDEKPAFEHAEYDIAKLKKTTDKYYEDKIVGLQDGIFEESAYVVMYSGLSRKIYRGKAGNKDWFSYLAVAVFLGLITIGFSYAFKVNIGINLSLLFRIFFALAIVSWLLSFIKREVIGLYDVNGSVAWWAYINRNNKAKIEKIVEFIQSKIPAEEKQ